MAMAEYDLSNSQIQHLAERLRVLLNDCWDAGVQVAHDAQVDGHCQGDYSLQPHGGGTGAVEVRWYPLIERWGVA